MNPEFSAWFITASMHNLECLVFSLGLSFLLSIRSMLFQIVLKINIHLRMKWFLYQHRVCFMYWIFLYKSVQFLFQKMVSWTQSGPGICKTMLRFHNWLGGLRIQNIVTFMTVFYYSKRRASKISKGKRHMGLVQGNQIISSISFLVESHRIFLILLATNCDNTREMWFIRKTH